MYICQMQVSMVSSGRVIISLVYLVTVQQDLTDCGLVTPYGDIDLG